jgi:hypothetical protein
MAKMRFLFLGTLLLLLFIGCSKDATEKDNPDLPSILKSDIVLHSGTINFEAKGNQVSAKSGSASGLLAKIITGSTASNPKIILGLTLAGINATGVYTSRNNAILTVSLDASNSNPSNVFSSELSVSVNVTEISDKMMSGTFSAKIVNEEGTLTGFLRNGQFRVRF